MLALPVTAGILDALTVNRLAARKQRMGCSLPSQRLIVLLLNFTSAQGLRRGSRFMCYLFLLALLWPAGAATLRAQPPKHRQNTPRSRKSPDGSLHWGLVGQRALLGPLGVASAAPESAATATLRVRWGCPETRVRRQGAGCVALTLAG